MSVLSEWGGCLPMEIHTSSPREYDGFDVLDFNTGRSAIYAAVLDMGAKRVWLPYYLCPTVRDFLVERDVNIVEYHIDGLFQPLIDHSSVRSDDVVVWTNWLGAVPSSSKDNVLARFNGRLIIDNCHACFEPPVRGAYNVFALRKVVGLPHGAFLVADSLRMTVKDMKYETIEDGVSFLELSTVAGSDAAYHSYQTNSHKIGSTFRRMHPIVRAAYAGVDWESIKRIRRKNVEVLRKELSVSLSAPWFDLDAGLPIWFPLYVEDEGLRERLIERRVWVPRLWKRILSMPDATELESGLAQWMLPLPIDQRYTEEDMVELAVLVRSLL